MIPPGARPVLGRISGSLRLTIDTDLKRLVLNVEDLSELLNQDGLESHRAGLLECRARLLDCRAAFETAMKGHASEVAARFVEDLPGYPKKQEGEMTP